jgi:small multidrug resistance family-3 protein
LNVIRSLQLFILAALAEIGGAWLIWQGWREHRGVGWIAAGVPALGIYGFVATFQPDPAFRPDSGRVRRNLRGELADLGMLVDRFHPDRWDYLGAATCLLGVIMIMYAPRG